MDLIFGFAMSIIPIEDHGVMIMTTEQENEVLKLKLKALQHQIVAFQLKAEIDELTLKYQQEPENVGKPST